MWWGQPAFVWWIVIALGFLAGPCQAPMGGEGRGQSTWGDETVTVELEW